MQCTSSEGDSVDKCAYRKKPKRTKKKNESKTKEQDIAENIETKGWAELNEDQTAVLSKNPPLIRLQGLVAKTDRQKIHDKVYTEVRSVHNVGKMDLFKYLKSKYLTNIKKQENKDLSLMNYVQGCRGAAWLVGNPQKATKCYKALLDELEKLDLKHLNIVCSLICYNNFVLYMDKGKPGKANLVMQESRFCLQNYFPSTWTSLLYKMQCRMYDHMAHVQSSKKERKEKWQQLAIKTYKIARDHSSKEHEDKYFALMYTIDIMYITLDMPTIDTTRDFRNTNIILQRLKLCNVSDQDTDNAFSMLNQAKNEVVKLSKSYQYKTNERIFYMGNIYYLVRKCQLSIQCSDYITAKILVEEIFDLVECWKLNSGKLKDSEFTYCPYLAQNIDTLLDQLDRHIAQFFNVRNVQHETYTDVDTDVESNCTELTENNSSDSLIGDSVPVIKTAGLAQTNITTNAFTDIATVLTQTNNSTDILALDITQGFTHTANMSNVDLDPCEDSIQLGNVNLQPTNYGEFDTMQAFLQPPIMSNVHLEQTDPCKDGMQSENVNLQLIHDDCIESGNTANQKELVDKEKRISVADCTTDVDSAISDISGLLSESSSGSDLP